ncbi:hypothetical protein [Streptomyces bauhiniae]|uniref:hypothetical protein n=1 Tax=Streptomyces bauhiniae TaxID=2340725 RepID=UPI0035DF0455
MDTAHFESEAVTLTAPSSLVAFCVQPDRETATVIVKPALRSARDLADMGASIYQKSTLRARLPGRSGVYINVDGEERLSLLSGRLQKSFGG